MKLLVHDYAGHPFQAQLSRALAARGHQVTHITSGSNPTSPKGAITVTAADPSTLFFDTIELPRNIVKTSFFDRWLLEGHYGALLARKIGALKPDVVISANTPLDALTKLDKACKKMGVPWVYWLQDLVGLATEQILHDKLFFIGQSIGKYYSSMESRLLRRSAAVIGIADEFKAIVRSAGVAEALYTTIPNWAPLDEINPRPKRNVWSLEQGLEDSFVFLYSGTLGFKHNPQLFVDLADALRSRDSVFVVINSEGPAADWLREAAKKLNLLNLRVNPFQKYNLISDVLGSADVLISILEASAGVFSVPSKILSYHCAARPILAAIDLRNPAARILVEQRTGCVVDPHDGRSFVKAALMLLAEGDERTRMAARARDYAQRTFDITHITDRFEKVFLDVVLA